MNVEISTPKGKPLTTADRSNAVAESLRQIARASRFADRKKGITSYDSHVKGDPLTPVLFVVLFVIPTLAALVFFGLIASDRYVTEAQFAIRPAIGGAEKTTDDKEGASGGMTGGGTKALIAQDTMITAAYVHSRPMVEAIERRFPLREMFSRGTTDWFSRLDPDDPIEDVIKYWAGRVNTQIDRGSGIITLTVNAFDAQESLELTKAIVQECERKVNEMSARIRDDSLAETTRELARAEENLKSIRFAMRDLRNGAGVLDVQKTNETNLKFVGELRKARIELAVQLALSQRDLAPESRRIQDLKAQIASLDENIEKIERESTSLDPERRRVLAYSMTQFETTENRASEAQKLYGKMLAAHEKARIIASRQVEFFTPVVEPVLAESATQPRRLLMISLVAAASMLAFALGVVIRRYAT